MTNNLENKICIILPAFNEEKNIKKLIDKITYLKKNYIILVVDDSLHDKTKNIIKSYNSSLIKIISRSNKLGRYSAVVEGIHYCFNNYKDLKYVVEMDSDLSHPPEIIPNLINQAINTNSDLVIASRHKKGGGFIGWPISRYFTHYGALILCKIFITTKLSDHFSAFRVYSIKSINVVMSNKNRKFIGFWGFGETIIDLQYAKCKFTEYPLIFKNRKEGKSTVNLITIIYTFFEILYTFYYKIKKNIV